MERRQALPGELGVRRRLVPAHAGHRVLGATLREAAELPRGRPGPAGAVPEESHRIVERERLPGAHERVLPQLAPAVAAGVHELRELAVRDLVPVEPEVRQLHLRGAAELEGPAGDEDHAGGCVGLPDQTEGALPSEGHRREGEVDRLEAGLLESEPRVPSRQLEAFDRRPAHRPPLTVGSVVRFHPDLGSGGIGLQRHRGHRDVRPKPVEGRVAPEDRLDRPGDAERSRDLVGVHQALHLRQRLASGPPLPGVAPPPPGDGRGDGEQQDGGHEPGRPGAARLLARGPCGLEVVEQRLSRGIPRGRVLLQAAAHDRLEARCDLGPEASRRRRGVAQDRRDEGQRRLALEGAPAGEQLVQERAEGEDVAARVQGTALRLLGRHVGRCPEQEALRGHRLGGRGLGIPRRRLGLEQLGEAEVEDLHRP